MNYVSSEIDQKQVKIPKGIVVAEDGTLLLSEELTEKIRAYGYDCSHVPYPNNHTLQVTLNTLERWLEAQIQEGRTAYGRTVSWVRPSTKERVESGLVDSDS